MQTIFLLLCIALLIGLSLFLGLQWYKARQFKSLDSRITEFVFRNVDAYILLVDSDFNVLKTNYYTRHNEQEDDPRPKLGNLLHCRNALDSGTCGGHELCDTCPVRQTISSAFRERRNLTKLEAALKIYLSDNRDEAVDCSVSVAGSYITMPDGSGQMLLTIHDITDLKLTQQELIQARLRAEESDRMKSLFLANTSHEFRTPLNAIVGFSELLAGDPTTEEKREYVGIIKNNNELLLQLVNDILDLSKIEAGTLEFEFTDEELNTVMEELEGSFQHRYIQNDNVKVRFDRKYPSCHVLADRRRLAQVVSNFLSNALKFTAEGEIVFGYEIRDEGFYFYVKDTGIGIPAEKLDSVFQRFVKIGSHKQGIGIGLAICKSIVESVGGQIGVDSEQGKGSTFWFTVPAQPRE